MSMRTMYELRDMLCDELDEIVKKGSISAGDLDAVHKLTDTIKNVYKIEMFSEQEGSSYDRGVYNRDGYGGREYSYADDDYAMANGRRGKHYVRGHYSRAEGDMMADKIEDMLQRGDMSVQDKNTLRMALEVLRK